MLTTQFDFQHFSVYIRSSVMDADIMFHMFICEDVFGFICRLRTANSKRKV